MAHHRGISPIDFLRERRSVVAAKITEPGPTPDELNSIIETGLRVPDHGICGPWRIQIIDKKGQVALGDLYSQLFASENKSATAEQIEYWRERPMSAPCLLAVTCYPNMEKLHKVPLIEQQMSVGALCLNLLNGAHAIGYSAQWLTEWPSYHDRVKERLGHNKSTLIAGFIFIGSALEQPKERRRIQPQDVVSNWDG
ncbi:MAG: nitroreductase [Pseudomonadota bacterium]|nr:nitroreductase [Pseudomonadota bacterium]